MAARVARLALSICIVALAGSPAAAQSANNGKDSSGAQAASQPAQKPAEGVQIPPFPPNPRVDKAKKEAEERRKEYEAAIARSNEPVTDDDAAAPARHTSPKRSGYDLFGGYAALHNGTDGLNFPLGWAAAISGPLTRWFDVVGEMSGAYKGSDQGTNVGSANVHTFTAGPQWSRKFPSGIKAYGQFQAGFTVGHASASGVSETSGGFALLPGGGADLPFMKGLGLRVGAEVPFVHDDGWWKGFRFVTGVVVAR